ncbi:hypothetical protein CVT25_000725 [Psilocybe cyanescens]|uniref:Uncharacterized protein n=1 Tax=Psilocybe cyanescens TaxID=93625 RepID=A0A409X3L7_PSICY|nr:hypothetical protein CVT25_000725 [Psilocybe cyanescens]
MPAPGHVNAGDEGGDRRQEEERRKKEKASKEKEVEKDKKAMRHLTGSLEVGALNVDVNPGGPSPVASKFLGAGPHSNSNSNNVQMLGAKKDNGIIYARWIERVVGWTGSVPYHHLLSQYQPEQRQRKHQFPQHGHRQQTPRRIHILHDAQTQLGALLQLELKAAVDDVDDVDKIGYAALERAVEDVQWSVDGAHDDAEEDDAEDEAKYWKRQKERDSASIKRFLCPIPTTEEPTSDRHGTPDDWDDVIAECEGGSAEGDVGSEVMAGW